MNESWTTSVGSKNKDTAVLAAAIRYRAVSQSCSQVVVTVMALCENKVRLRLAVFSAAATCVRDWPRIACLENSSTKQQQPCEHDRLHQRQALKDNGSGGLVSNQLGHEASGGSFAKNVYFASKETEGRN